MRVKLMAGWGGVGGVGGAGEGEMVVKCGGDGEFVEEELSVSGHG